MRKHEKVRQSHIVGDDFCIEDAAKLSIFFANTKFFAFTN